jgi:peptidoglycan/LPS O-acetylase OafA/YrhL
MTTAAPEVVQAGESRLARLESVRALAALGVLVGHCYGIPRGFVPSSSIPGRIVGSGFWGVFVFFALTGYLMTRPLLAAAYGGPPADLLRYTRNRALRVLPLYYVVLAVVLVVQHHGGDVTTWLRFGLFLENYGTTPAEVVDGPMWSLVVEVQFYALAPVLVWLLAKTTRDLRVAGLLLLAFAAVTLTVHQLVEPRSLNVQRSLPLELFWFTPGMLLAWLQLSRPTWLRGLLGRSDAWAAGAVLAWAVAVHRGLPDIAVAVASFLLLAACVLDLRDGVTRWLLDRRLLAAVGTISYGIYLWHIPVLIELHRQGTPNAFGRLLLGTLPLSLLLAAASYRLVEAPFLRLRRRWS